MRNEVKFLLSAFIALSLVFGSFSQAADYRPRAKRAQTRPNYLEKDHTLRRALSLGRQTGALSVKDVDAIYKALVNNSNVPQDLMNTWQKLLRISQILTHTFNSQTFFPVGYEYETVYPTQYSSENFAEGAEKFQKLLAETMGLQSARTYNEVAIMRDSANREWKLVREFVRMTEWEAGGYEFVSPPIRDPGTLQDISALTWRLGTKKFGQSNNMTGGHQTFTIVPNGEIADDRLIARMVTNIQLLQAQYVPTIFEILDIKRGGGPQNAFMRPIVLDHPELIDSLKKQNPETMTLKETHDLFFRKHVDKEFERMVARERDFAQTIDQAEYEARMKWGPEERSKLPKLWKYRDEQIKFNLENPMRTLAEWRIGDWVADRPEQTMLITFLRQHVLRKAWELSKEGKIFQPKYPKRLPGEDDLAYWNRLRLNPEASREKFLQTLGVNDPDMANLILGRNFNVVEPGFRALKVPSNAFEAEGWNDNLVDIIVPNDPKLRLEWPEMSRNKKIKKLEGMGISLGEYSEGASLRLSTEFKVDTARFEHMNPDIIMEMSGNWEVTSNGRNLYSPEAVEVAAKPVAREIEEFGLHMHQFLPEEYLQAAKANPRKFTKALERQSLAMLLDGYAETDPEDAYHALDSWSLDRPSPKDLKQIEAYLEGKGKIGYNAQKYHNIAFRPVDGGLDLEVRDLGDDLKSGVRQLKVINETINGNFGPLDAEKSPDLFMEFADHADPYGKSTRRYTLLDAVEKKYPLTEQQKKLLQKLQFEIYKPSMAEYMFFINPESKDPYWSYNDIPEKYLDPKAARANFENNLAIPLLNYEEQNYLTYAEKDKLAKGREAFVDRIHKLMLEVEKDAKYKFLLEEDNFLHLADYLKRSTHPNAKKIDFKKTEKKAAEKQRELLEELTNRVRGETIRFVRQTKVNEIMRASLPSETTRALATKTHLVPSACKELYKSIR